MVFLQEWSWNDPCKGFGLFNTSWNIGVVSSSQACYDKIQEFAAISPDKPVSISIPNVCIYQMYLVGK